MSIRPACLVALIAAAVPLAVPAVDLPVTAQQRATAEQVAARGVPLAELAPNAPSEYTVRRGDTLWAISGLFLRSPWRWPELWGMNKGQIANPHLIYPGQTLYLIRRDGYAMLSTSRDSVGSDRLSPRVREGLLDEDAISAIPLHLIQPFLTEAVVLDQNTLESAPRIVAVQEGRVMLSRGDLGYVRGELNNGQVYRVYRQARPLTDPATKKVLGYEAFYLGAAELQRLGGTVTNEQGKAELVPSTVQIRDVKREIGVGDRLAPAQDATSAPYVPHAPDKPISGQVVSIYGDSPAAGQHQVVALNRGRQEGLERGHVLKLWRAGRAITDRTYGKTESVRLPDEELGVLFVFQVYSQVSYALIIKSNDVVTRGDRFTQP